MDITVCSININSIRLHSDIVGEILCKYDVVFIQEAILHSAQDGYLNFFNDKFEYIFCPSVIRDDFVVGKWVTNWSLLPSSQFSIQELQNLINSNASQSQILDSIYKIFNL